MYVESMHAMHVKRMSRYLCHIIPSSDSSERYSLILAHSNTAPLQSCNSLFRQGECMWLTTAEVHRRDDLTERMDGRVRAGMVTLGRGLIAFQQGRKLRTRLRYTQRSLLNTNVGADEQRDASRACLDKVSIQSALPYSDTDVEASAGHSA